MADEGNSVSVSAGESNALVRLNVAGRELGVSSKTVKKYCRCGILRCLQLPSGQWRVYRTALDALHAQSETDPNRPNLPR